MKAKTSELTGATLDWAVAKCQYPDAEINTKLGFPFLIFGRFHPSGDWSHGGPIIEREEIELSPHGYGRGWSAIACRTTQHGPTPLVAAMRCYVASKMGDEIEVPDELGRSDNE